MTDGPTTIGQWLGVGLSAVLLSTVIVASSLAQSHPVHSGDPPPFATISDEDSLRTFLNELQRATARFRNHAAAVASGYRWMGPDMPNMGEHWINPRRVMRPFDPMRPSCLSYLRRGETRILTGIAYIVPVRPGEQPPQLPFAGEWHFHVSTLDEEAFGHRHDHMSHDHMSGNADRVRLAMMHVWTEVSNPDGPLTADNWALSYVRANLPVPPSVSPTASKALFLSVEEGVDFYLNVVQSNGAPTPEDLVVVERALTEGRQSVRAALARSTEEAPPADHLEGVWHATWTRIRDSVPPPLWEDIRPAVMGDSP